MTTTKVRVTLIDDDPAARAALARHLRDEHFDVMESEAGTRAGPDAVSGPQCVILTMPNAGPDSYRSIRDFRATDDRPMIALNVRDHPVDRIVALELGADDVIDRGADPREVSARIRAILRRIRGFTPAADPGDRGQISILRFGRWSIDVVHRRVFASARGEVDMTSGEFDILRCFVQNPLRPLSRQEILDATRGARYAGYERSIDVLIGRIRRKIEDDQSNPKLIQTVRGVGYVLASTVRPV